MTRASLAAVLLAVGLAASLATGEAMQVTTYPAPRGIAPSADYQVQVNDQPVFVYTANVLHGGPASFAYFDFAGRVTVKVTVQRPAPSPVVRPLSAGIKPKVDGQTLSFTLERPANLSIEPDGPSRPLLLFANPPEQDPPKPGDPNVLYFGPGIHEIGTTQLASGATVYVAGGAIVRGKILPDEKPVQEKNWAGNKVYRDLLIAEKVRNVTIRGRGIIDGSTLPWHSKCPMSFHDCQDVRVEGIIVTDSPCWVMPVFGCRTVRYVNVKQICHRENSDGINIVNSQDVQVEGCFLRNNDDEVCVKTTSAPPAPEARDITVRNCVIWNDRAYGLGITYETRADIRDLRFVNCDVIHDTGIAALAIHVSDGGTMSNITFQNVRVEQSRSRLIRMWIGKDMWGHDANRGRIRNVLFDGLSFLGEQLPPSEITGADAEHAIEGVAFRDFRVAGKSVASAQQARISLRHATGVEFAAPTTQPAP